MPSAKIAASPWLGYSFAAGAAILFATKGIIIKLAYAYGTDATSLLALRMGFSMPIYGAILANSLRKPENRPALKTVFKAFGVGLIGYWYSSWADFKGLEYISPQFERLILFTYPLFVLCFGALFFGGKFKRLGLIAFGISYLGLMMIFVRDWRQEGAGTAIGAAFVLTAAVTFALYQLLAKKVLSDIGPMQFTCISMSGAGSVAIAQFLLSTERMTSLLKPEVLGYGVILAAFATVIPSFLMTAALSRITAQANSMIGIMSPVVTLLLSVVLLGSVIDWVDIIGTALVVGGIGAYTVAEQRGR